MLPPDQLKIHKYPNFDETHPDFDKSILQEDLVTFGPYYRMIKSNGKLKETASSSDNKALKEAELKETAWSSDNKELKEAAWRHLLRKTAEWELLRGNALHEKVIENNYIEAMNHIDQEARDFYADQMDGVVDFPEIMIKDGSFYLQLVIYFLGHSAKLEYDESNPVFSLNSLKHQEQKWIKSMLFVGNQIPYIVLEELMKQSFFQVVIKKIKFDHQSDLLRRAFYELLVLGGLDRNSGFSLHRWLPVKLGFSSELSVPTQPPSNLLDCLKELVIGGGEEDMPKDKNHYVVHVFEGSNDEVKIPTATELREKGIKIKEVKDGRGIRGIHFANKWYSTSLLLPNLIIGEYTELIFKCIQDYELLEEIYLNNVETAKQIKGKGKGIVDEVPKISPNKVETAKQKGKGRVDEVPKINAEKLKVINREKLEVSSYLKFLNELVREPTDAKLLHDAGVLEADTMQRGRLPIFLKAAVQDSVAIASGNLHLARINIAEYSYAPFLWRGYLRDILGLIGIIDLTYSAVSYHKKKD